MVDIVRACLLHDMYQAKIEQRLQTMPWWYPLPLSSQPSHQHQGAGGSAGGGRSASVWVGTKAAALEQHGMRWGANRYNDTVDRHTADISR